MLLMNSPRDTFVLQLLLLNRPMSTLHIQVNPTNRYNIIQTSTVSQSNTNPKIYPRHTMLNSRYHQGRPKRDARHVNFPDSDH